MGKIDRQLQMRDRKADKRKNVKEKRKRERRKERKQGTCGNNKKAYLPKYLT